MRKRRELSEADVRIRPPRTTKPRTKDRPDYSQAQRALVIGVDRGRTLTNIEGREVIAMKARELGKKSVVVGDIVALVGDVTGNEGTLARIVAVDQRRNSLSRTIDDSPDEERTIVANMDQLMIVIAAANPEPRHGFVDRALIVAFDQGLTPLIVMTKRDLADGEDFLTPYRDLDIRILKTERGADLSELHQLLKEKRTVLLGHSGVGKSTLVNALIGNESRATGEVNTVTGRGRHTSSSAVALELRAGGWIVDTPGVRSFGIAHIERSRIIRSFPEFAVAIEHCPRNCSHDESACALNSGPFLTENDRRRLSSLRRILSEANSSNG